MNPNDPAFPAEWTDAPSGQTQMFWAKGLTKREYVALEMMKALVITHAILNWRNPLSAPDAKQNLQAALVITDGFIEELSK